MDFSFTEEQEELRQMARSFLADHAGGEQVRAAMESEAGYDPAVWKRIGAELGWPSLLIPEAYGGLELSWVELAALLETTGEAILCAPLFSTVCLATPALLLAASDEQKQALLPGIAEGTTCATLAHAEATGSFEPGAVATEARSEGDEIVLRGTKRFVVDGASTDLLVVSAREPGSSGDEGLSLFAVPAETPGVARRALPTMDQTRRLAEIELADVRVPASARLGAAGGAHGALAKTLDLACIGLAAEQIGGAQRCLDLSVAYAKERVQYGRVIGSFQAIKHKLANMMVALEAARSGVYYAACVAAEDSGELPAAASLAKATASDAFFRCAGDAIQIHGGVGFTWEYDIHLHFKRARAGRSYLGSPDEHRERIAKRIGL